MLAPMEGLKSNNNLTGEEIVISGISGLFPSSSNIEDFMNNLYNNVDMIESSEPYWNFNNPEVPKYIGKVKGFSQFDAQFFKVPYGQVAALDAMTGKVLEESYSAIFDAGLNPTSLAGTKVGVYIGTSHMDAAALNVFNKSLSSGYIISGASRAMLANRVSYWLDSTAPSMGIDQGCSSSMCCLEVAFKNFVSGRIDSAIVGGCNCCVHPILTYNLKRANLLCGDGKTKSFDDKGDGYVRSEAINILFLQRAKNAKRIYSELYYIKQKYFFRPDASFLQQHQVNDIVEFLNEFYSEIDVDPKEVDYIEGHGCGLRERDTIELKAISKVFGKEKTVMVGSVKSNMGNSEGASSVCSVTKLCLAYKKGELPANLHFESNVLPQNIKVLTENTAFSRGFTAVNAFSYCGSNFHALLKHHYKPKDETIYFKTSSTPRLVLVSGRTEACVEKILNILENNPIDPEQIALLHEIFKTSTFGHLSRGYTILDKINQSDTKCIAANVNHCEDGVRPVCFMYSGMGSQWLGMGADLMRLPLFAGAIEKCNRVLISKGIDVVKIITDTDKATFNIINTFVGIAAIQVGLTDILKEIGIVPDTIIGHSLGELGCAYADHCLTAEETILLAYYRGLAMTETKPGKGMMAAVQLDHKTVVSMCPPEIEAACHNSSESTTISGPIDLMTTFINDLQQKGIFAKKVNTSNIAYHSKYIAEAGPILLEKTKNVIQNPKKRSEKWICTSQPPECWDSEAATSIKAEYFVNNLLNNVYFQEASTMIPNNAIVIEIAPHGLLQAIVRRSHKDCIHIRLTKRNHPNPVNYFLEALGKLYQNGLNLEIDVLYPKVNYPVSTETPLLSHLVNWEHSESRPVTKYDKGQSTKTATREVYMSLKDDDWKYLIEFSRNGVNVLPEAVFIFLIWETFSMHKEAAYNNMAVVLEDVQFHTEINVQSDETSKFTIEILKGCGKFEITTANNVIVCSGLIKEDEHIDIPVSSNKRMQYYCNTISTENVYNTLKDKGYNYKNSFQTISSLNAVKNLAKVRMDGNWVTFLDSFIQLHILINDEKAPLPLKVRKIRINPHNHWKVNNGEYDVQIHNEIFTSTSSPIIQIDEITFTSNHSSKYNELNFLKSEASKIVPLSKEFNIAYVGLYSKCSNESFRFKDSIHTICSDFSGIHRQSNQKIMGVIKIDSLGNNIIPDSNLQWTVPESWSLREAATVPLPYIHAYYCLNNLSLKGHTAEFSQILVTEGNSPFGQAIITICLGFDCSVITTVDDEKQKKFLLQQFPLFKHENILYSSDDYLVSDVLIITKGMKCTVVINSSENTVLREMVMKCVRNFGVFLDISYNDMKSNETFGQYYLKAEKSYNSVRVSNLFVPVNVKDRQVIQEQIENGMATGLIKPLKREVYTQNEIIQFSMTTEVNNDTDNNCNVGTNKKIIVENKVKTGLNLLYSFIEKDECASNHSIVKMDTLLEKASFEMFEEINPQDDYLIIIPGMEGHHHIFTTICESIKIKAITVQLGVDVKGSNIKDIAKNILKEIEKSLQLNKKFYILGYSFGINVALELGAIIETLTGQTGVIYCLESSPDELKLFLKEHFENLSDHELQNAIIMHMHQLITGKDGGYLEEGLNAVKNWDEKLDLTIVKMRNLCTLSHDYKRLLIDSLYKRILLARDYETNIELASDIVLIKNVDLKRKINNDYNLAKYTTKSVHIFEVSSNGVITQNAEVPIIINKMLDARILKEFEMANLCLTYLSFEHYV